MAGLQSFSVSTPSVLVSLDRQPARLAMTNAATGQVVAGSSSGGTQPPPPATYNTTLTPGQSTGTLTFRGVAGSQFKLNVPLSAKTDPNPAYMLINNQTGTNLAHIDFSGYDAGRTCAFVYQGTTYSVSLTAGTTTLSV